MRLRAAVPLHASVALVLTVLTFTGGAAWLSALAFRRRWLALGALYLALSATLWVAAPLWGRQPMPCWGEPLRAKGIYCAMNRTYVTPELALVLADLAGAMEAAHPGTITLMLDGGFPATNLPLLPHLSHDDGQKADLAFWYRDAQGYAPARTPSPLGYFAFEAGPTDCRPGSFSLRWNLAWLQPFWPEMTLDGPRLETALALLEADGRVGKVFVEPHLAQRHGAGSKVRFQGCRAARHDDHIHLQL
ncbi:hypothetical protein [Vannielia litorea]|uniref:Transmembrane protein n=1 Tax=Vannielia litorea TaxID=1217970 RepID=A0A1N6DZ31_9RHOB|nr:hypothetical protein [Vannielia litorea]SIN76046.1 hypothetical protein SAMN05444002_0164 [Vannielia litorea]